MVRLLPVGVITGAGMLGTATGNLIEDHNISLHSMLAVGAVVIPAAWWLANRLGKLDSQVMATENKLEFTHQRMLDRLTAIEKAIDSLPCESKCAPGEKPRPKIRPHIP